MGARKRTADKNRQIVEAFKNGTAIEKIDSNGVRSVVIAKPVKRSFKGTRIFYSCPKCGKTLHFRRKKHSKQCIHCKQNLSWNDIESMQCVYLLIKNPEDAYFWAMQYKFFNGDTYGIDIDKWRLIDRNYPMVMFFPFPDGKGYGRFMREAAKEGVVITYF